MKQDNLFFFFFWSCWDLPNHNISWGTFNIFGKLSMNRGALTGLKLFGTIMWKLLIIEPFFQWKLYKIKIEKYTRIWGHSLCAWKALGESDLIELISQISKLSCERYWCLILLLEIQTNCKKWVWKEKLVKPSMCSHLGQQHKWH
jgi:hypothetical protein